MPSETAWKPRFSCLWSGTAPSRAVRLSQAHLRVLVALEAYRQVRLPGVPGPAAVNRVANEIRGLDMVLEVLGRQDMAARATEAFQHASEGADEWREICRDYILTAEHLLAVERRAREFRARLGGDTPANLPLARYVGHHLSLIDHRPSADPLGRLRDAALEAKIVTPADIRNARDE